MIYSIFDNSYLSKLQYL